MPLREALEAAVNTAEEAQTPVTPVAETVTPVETVTTEPVKTEAVETDAQKAGRTAGRARDEHGRLLPGKAEKPAEVAAEPQVQRPPRPSSWKKEMWEHYDKFDPKVAEYIHQRESEFAKGVSTYKNDYESVKPLADAIRPYAPFIQHAGIKPEEFIDRLAKSDQTLRFGQPEEKLKTFARLAQDYQIPLHQLLVQGEDGKVYLNQQYFEQQAKQQSQGITPQDVDRIVAQKMQAAQIQSAVANFVAAKDSSGNPLYPHFETVKSTMDGILRAGLAQDLPTAYTKALRMHDDIWEAEQKSKQEAAQKAQQEAQAKQVGKAKSTAVSVKSATPASEGTKSGKGIRAHLETAMESHETGRV